MGTLAVGNNTYFIQYANVFKYLVLNTIFSCIININYNSTLIGCLLVCHLIISISSFHQLLLYFVCKQLQVAFNHWYILNCLKKTCFLLPFVAQYPLGWSYFCTLRMLTFQHIRQKLSILCKFKTCCFYNK